MITYFRSSQYRPAIKKVETLQQGSWIRCEKPNEAEIAELITLGMDADILSDALDPHEVPRVEYGDDWTYFITRLPDADDQFNDFTTPMLFAIGPQHIVTVSREQHKKLWTAFTDSTEAPTTQKTRLFLLMMDTVSLQYQRRVAGLNRQIRTVTTDVSRLRSKDITVIVEYERRLNDYLDALIPTNTALEKLLSGKVIRLYDDDRDLVEDVSIEIEQLMARCTSLLRTITNVRDSFRAVMDTRLNETIRLLTVITLALTIPTMIAGLFGMNVPLPSGSDSPNTFWEIVAVSVFAAAVLSYYFLKKR